MLESQLELYDCIAYSIIITKLETPLIPMHVCLHHLHTYTERSYPVITPMWQLGSRVRPGEFQS